MPKYEVTAPDGRVFEVDAPDGATQDEVLAYAQQNYQSASPQTQLASAGATIKRVQYPDGSIHRIEVPEGATNDQTIAFAQQDYQQRSSATTRLQKIEQALRAADAAGNSDDARILAQAYVDERAKAAPTSQYSVDELFGKLERADAAGDTEAARVIADEIRRNQSGAPEAGNSWDRDEIVQPAAQGDSWQQDPQLVELPDGTLVEFPAGTSRDVMKQAIHKHLGSQPRPDFSNVRGGSDTMRADGNNPANNSDFARLISGKPKEPQGYWQQRMHELRGVGEGARYAVADTALGIGQLVGGADEQDVAAFRQKRDRARERYGEAFTGGQFVGDAIQTLGPAGAVNRLRGASALVGNAALGAGYAGLKPVTEGESRGANAATGAAFGAGAHLGARGLAALGRNATNAVPAEVRQMAQRAREMGIPLHASQVSQSLPVKVAASAGKYLPFSGYAKAASRQQEAVNSAVGGSFGAKAPKLTDDVMDSARREMSQQFESIYNRNAVPITEKAARRLAGIEREAARRLTNDEAQVLRNQLDDILDNAEDGVLTGQKYQAVRTALRKAEGPDKLGTAVRELRQALDELAAESVGASDAAALKTLRSQWANFRTAEKALKQNSGAGGDIRLASLWPLIRNGSTKEMRELARMGQTVLKDPIADSGTAQRTLAYNLLMGGSSIANPALIPLIAKAAAGGATIGRAANSDGLARLLTRANRGRPTSRLAELIQQATPYTAPAAAASYNDMGGR